MHRCPFSPEALTRGLTKDTVDGEQRKECEVAESVRTRATADTRVQLCVITYRRPLGLARLLQAIDRLDVDDGVEIGVVVVDNDAEGAASTVVEAHRATGRYDVSYFVEPRRGISSARNTALARALELKPDWIGWLDDDEAPQPDWLARLLATHAEFGGDVVFGPNQPEFEPSAPAWIRESGLFTLERFATGEHYPFFHTRTSGVIMRAEVAPAEGFDQRLNFIGGEDRMFFTRVHRAGGVFVYDAEALVTEYIPTSRANLRWLFKRWYRTGVTRSLILLYLDDPGRIRRARRVAGGVAMALRGLLQTVLAIRHGRLAVVRRFRLVLLGAGASMGALGARYQEYQTTHGS